MAYSLPRFFALVCLAFSLTTLSVSSVATAQDQTENSEQVSTETGTASGQESETSIASPKAEINERELLFEGKAPTSVEELRFLQDHFAELAERMKPAIVNIQMDGAQGSGVVISSDGYILTAAHVIGDPFNKADITFPDGKKVEATTLGINRSIDSGMLKINDDSDEEFPYIDLGLSDDLVEGQIVMAIGHPGGIDVARGLVVRIGRIIEKSSYVLNTDCTLVGGDSGGPLFNMDGEIIGIHSRMCSEL